MTRRRDRRVRVRVNADRRQLQRTVKPSFRRLMRRGGGVGFYDRDARPIDWCRYMAIRANDRRAWRVAVTSVAGRRVSTVWLGIDHQWRIGETPLVFETLVFERGAVEPRRAWRYPTIEAARRGHAAIVQAIKEEEATNGRSRLDSAEHSGDTGNAGDHGDGSPSPIG